MLAGMLLTACADATPRCVPGGSSLCVCPNGSVGAQTCNADGHYEACVCDGASNADGSVPNPECSPTSTTGCTKVDFLFVIDNSLSMAPMQDNLVMNFASTFASIRERLGGVTDYHLMFIDSDSYGYEGALCEGACRNYDPSLPLPGDSGCGGYVCGSLARRSECDTVLGAGVVQPFGAAASNRDCGFPTGRRWLSSSDGNLDELAACAARVGATGDGDELVLEAAIAAVDPASEAARCNAGFSRQDALLVVVLVSDAGFTSSEQARGPEGYRRRLLQTKCGREDGIVVVGLIADGSLAAPNPPPGFGDSCFAFFTGTAPTYTAFVDAFGDRGFRGNVCELDYSEVFSRALDTIELGCNEFVW